MKNFLKQTAKKGLEWAAKIRRSFSPIRWFSLRVFYRIADTGNFFPSQSTFKIKPQISIPKATRPSKLIKTKRKKWRK